MQCKGDLVLFLFVVSIANSYGAQADKCIKIKLIPNFDLKQGHGVWYSQVIGGPDTKNFGDCLYYNVTGSNNITTMPKKTTNGEYVKEDLIMAQEGNTSKIIFKPEPNRNIDNWWVDTDYISWAVYYQCDKGKGIVISSTRKRAPDAETMKKMLASMKKNGFSTEKPDLMTINQFGCTN